MYLVGTSETSPRTQYFWSEEYNAMAKVAVLDNLCIVRASKPLRLVAQGSDRTGYWASNLSKLNSYLAGRANTSGGGFRFRLSVDFVPEAAASVTVNQDEVRELVEEMSRTEAQLQELEQERVQTEKQIQNGFEQFLEPNRQRRGGS